MGKISVLNQNVRALEYKNSMYSFSELHVCNSKMAFFDSLDFDILLLMRGICLLFAVKMA